LVAAGKTVVSERRLACEIVVAVACIADSIGATNDDVSASAVGSQALLFGATERLVLIVAVRS